MKTLQKKSLLDLGAPLELLLLNPEELILLLAEMVEILVLICLSGCRKALPNLDAM